eukprot:5696126-Pleurochrysis_carterae.AAC.1
MARVTHRAAPRLTALDEATGLTESGATATAARCAVATRKGTAQASSALSGEARSLTSAVRTAEGSGASRDCPTSRSESPNMRSREA